jgi:hypothetical protein
MKYIITESQYRKLQEQRVKGEEVSPEKYVTHTSNPINRDSIMEHGIRATLGECYMIYADSNYNEEDECVPAVFATNSIKKKDLFDSTYDDDIWVINTEIANVQWYNDAHFEGGDYKHIVTFEDIPVESIKLVYKGTGDDSLGNHNDDDELTLTESTFFNRRVNLDKVKRILKIHSDQVYYETESYDQFKYELTLRAVEAALNQDHGLGWEDLPSEEEIKFVTEVSNMFEDLIKHLYKSHLK